MWNVVLRKTNCIRFGRYASLSACVLFAGGCVVRIGYESFLDVYFSEVFLFLEWRTAVHFISLRFLLLLIIHSLQGAACPLFRGCPAPLSLRDISPHCGESPSPSWASSTAVAYGSYFSNPSYQLPQIIAIILTSIVNLLHSIHTVPLWATLEQCQR